MHYKPEGKSFKLVEGKRRFNRALYGGNTAFRVEAGDLPEFALYLPGMGGNLRLGIAVNSESKWITDCDSVETWYDGGVMRYKIRDRLLGQEVLDLEVFAGRSDESLILQSSANSAELFVCFGGVTGKRFSRDGDIGADPESSFYLQPEYCKGNNINTSGQGFSVASVNGFSSRAFEAYHVRPDRLLSPLRLSQALQDTSAALLLRLPAGPLTLALGKGLAHMPDADLEKSLTTKMAQRVKISSSDPFLDPLGPALSLAADAIWEAPSYMHGAVAWRMRLPGWRGPYVADVLGWHDRARMHFDAYARSQYVAPATGPYVMDTTLHLARGLEKAGTSMFSSGYISREPGGKLGVHHYDMNLVYMDALLQHLRWTGDTAWLRSIWPVIVRHLDWEKRNFDPDGDHLYDAYAAIWASDALQYSGGAVTHSSAYNYRMFAAAAQMARLLGVDGSKYQTEADAIKKAMFKELWVKNQDVLDKNRKTSQVNKVYSLVPDETEFFAEYRDALSPRIVHTSPAIWTYYTAIESGVTTLLQSASMIRHALENLPQIPLNVQGIDGEFYMVSTSNWQPYTWSLNNVAMAEQMDLALAAFMAQKPADGYTLFKSALMESMYLGASPGNFQQLSQYDAIRGELYRDFADPIGVTARTLVEGVIGFRPNLLEDEILINPALSAGSDSFSYQDPQLSVKYNRKENDEFYNYQYEGRQPKVWKIILARKQDIAYVKVNGKKYNYQVDDSVGVIMLQPKILAGEQVNISVRWKGIPQIVSDCACSAVSRPSPYKPKKFKPVDLNSYYNDSLTKIFREQYQTPRWPYTTLALPTQGIGNWAYPLVKPVINDSGLRGQTAFEGISFFKQMIEGKNIIYTSLWDAYPDSVVVPLSGKARGVALLLTGTTNAMQSQMENGQVVFRYTDGSEDILHLHNPSNWWPIEQDLLNDGKAFTTGAALPLRISLTSGKKISAEDYTEIKGFSWKAVKGGAASILEFPLDSNKTLRSVTIKATAHDVVIGLAGLAIEPVK